MSEQGREERKREVSKGAREKREREGVEIEKEMRMNERGVKWREIERMREL